MGEVDKSEKSVTRSRNAVVEVLTQGDVFVLDGEYFHVTDGEIIIYADKTIDKRLGEVEEISAEYLPFAIAAKVTVVNVDEL